LKKIISPDGSDNTIVINQDTTVFTSILEKDKTVKYTLGEDRAGYIHLAQTGGKLSLNDSTKLKFVLSPAYSPHQGDLTDGLSFSLFFPPWHNAVREMVPSYTAHLN
jgi:hypothetical protein